MDLIGTTIDKETAEAKFVEYRDAVRARHDAEDQQIMRGYDEVRKGRQVISLTATLRAGGRDDHGLPRLAIARADQPKCWLELCDYEGAVTFCTKTQREGRHAMNVRDVRRFPKGTLPGIEPPEGHATDESVIRAPVSRNRRWNPHHTGYQPIYRAIVPSVPPALRPRHALGNYDVLWEVDQWEVDPKPPVDPALLRHIGGDLYAVMAVWDLTDLERLVLAARADKE